MNTFLSKVRYIWQNAENLLIILFLATFTLNIRKVFLTPYSFLNGEFNEYMTLNFSWTDLLMLAVIIIYTIKTLFSQSVNHNTGKSLFYIVIRFLSSVIRRNTVLLRCLKNVSRETITLLLFLFWIGISIFWSSYQFISVYKFIVLVELILFALIAIKSLKNPKWLNLAFFALIFNGFFQSIIGITQFIHNKSLGIYWLGESILGPNIDGVAKLLINGEKHIRAYGTLPHPNILAGFLIISIFVILKEIAERFANPKNNSDKVPRETIFNMIPNWLLTIFLVVIFIGFSLTFSRSAFLGLLFGLLVFIFLHKQIVFRRLYFSIAGLIMLAVIAGGYFMHFEVSKLSIFSTQSLDERNLYQIVSRETISAHPIVGIGIGQFVLQEFQKYPNLEGWQYQPVHNIYLLIFSELGMIGLALFLLFIILSLKRNNGVGDLSSILTIHILYCIIYSFLFISLFDHYFWDIKPGMILFVLPIIFLTAARDKTNSIEP